MEWWTYNVLGGNYDGGQAIHQSHLNFIKACLDQHIIPSGLWIKKVPYVANKFGLRRGLLAVWQKTLRETSKLLLQHLKRYHKKSGGSTF